MRRERAAVTERTGPASVAVAVAERTVATRATKASKAATTGTAGTTGTDGGSRPSPQLGEGGDDRVEIGGIRHASKVHAT